MPLRIKATFASIALATGIEKTRESNGSIGDRVIVDLAYFAIRPATTTTEWIVRPKTIFSGVIMETLEGPDLKARARETDQQNDC